MRCPVCKAQVEQGPQCRRCRADLSLLLTLEEQRKQALAQAYHWLGQRAWQQASAQADRAETLRQGEDIQRFRAVLSLLQQDFKRAWHYFQRRTDRNHSDR